MHQWFLENNHQHHLELLLSEDRMGMLGRHHNGFALPEHIFLSVDGDLPHAVQAGDKGIAGRLMGADLLALVKENSVTLTAAFCASVRLTTCPG